jgi:hypothetical protein
MEKPLYPDPVLTANVYCLNGLDEVIRRAVAPFWRELKQQDVEDLCYLWLLRYSKGGDHLKIRLHGPESWREEMKRGLGESIERFLASIGPAEDTPAPKRWKGVPPVDVEDEVETPHPDRSFLWTEYRRNDVSLGRRPLFLDDRYTALLTTCLGRGTELLLEAFAAERGETIPHSLRQTTLLHAAIAALGAVGFSPEKRTAYLVYHRDWLLRFALVKNGVPSVAAAEVIERFDRRLPGMAKTLDLLRRRAAGQWEEGRAEGRAEGTESRWRDAMGDLARYLRVLCTSPEYHVDPFASDPLFTPIFKALHGLGNQTGLLMMDEALGYHILLAATAAPDALGRNSVQLVAG